MTSRQATYYQYATPHGIVTIGASERGITHVEFAAAELTGRNVASAHTNRAATELQEYLAGKRRIFEVPLDMQGSAFQQSVWVEVAGIPYGQIRTPAELAGFLGKPGAHRSVGTAVRQCTLAPFIPTHRVALPGATGKRAKIFRALCAMEASRSADV